MSHHSHHSHSHHSHHSHSGDAQSSTKHLKLPHTCRNCGLVGHLYRDCPHPIMSFGLICYRMNTDKKIEYLMIQRKDSLSFMEFVRGKYSLNDIDYIKSLLSFMTHNERRILETSTFQELWNIVWYQPHAPRHSQEYTESKVKYESLKHGYISSVAPGSGSSGAGANSAKQKGVLVLLKNLIQQTSTHFHEPEWGFPKGRRKLKEEDVDCAIREFCEESGFDKSDISVHKNIQPLEEFFYGTNKILYRHVYYIAHIVKNDHKVITIDPHNPHQAREVRQAKWLSYNEVMERIRPYNKERKDLFKEAHRIIHEKHSLLLSKLSVDSNEFKPQATTIFKSVNLDISPFSSSNVFNEFIPSTYTSNSSIQEDIQGQGHIEAKSTLETESKSSVAPILTATETVSSTTDECTNL